MFDLRRLILIEPTVRLLRFGLLACALLAGGLPLAGCADGSLQKFKTEVGNVASAITSAKINRKAVFTAASVANGLISTADIYLSLPICGKAPCRNPAATEPIANAQATLSSARSAMLDFMKAHPGELGDKGLYDAMVLATSQIKSIFATYGVNS